MAADAQGSEATVTIEHITGEMKKVARRGTTNRNDPGWIPGEGTTSSEARAG